MERYPKCKFAKRARRNQEKHKEQKRQYERAPKAKVSRVQRKAARFWAPCLSNWRAMDQEGDIDEQTRAANSGAAYAPRFHPDGRVSIIQGGAEKFLPCPLEPSKGADQEQVDEFLLALELRCRTGAINCRRLGFPTEVGCCKKWDRRATQDQRETEKRRELPAIFYYHRASPAVHPPLPNGCCYMEGAE